MESTKSAAIYVRISKDREGRELGVERQEQDCRRLADRLGYGVTVFKDNDVSASTLSRKVRPAFDDMMRRAEQGEFSAIIAYSNSRLTRRVVELSRLIEVARKTGIRVHTVVSGQHDLDTADGRATMLTIATWDQAEAERASERIKREKLSRAERGEWHGGHPPYGYRAEDRRLVLNPDEVALIKDASRRLLEDGEPLHSIVTDWNSPKKPGSAEPKHATRYGKHWRQTGLRAILTNRSLLGETKSGVVGWEPALDQRTFDRLQALLTDPSRKVTHSPGVKGGKYSMGGGLTVCGACGKRLITAGKPRPQQGGKRQVALACLQRVNGRHPQHRPVKSSRVVHYNAEGRQVRSKGDAVRSERIETTRDTGRVTIDHDALEEYVFSEVIQLLEETPRWHQRMAEKDPAAEQALDRLDRERADLDAQRERAQKAYVVGIMSEREAQGEVVRINAKIERVDREKNALLREPVLGEILAEGTLRDWRSWAPGRRRTFLRLLIDRVEIGPWPEDEKRSFSKRRAETDEDFRERLHADMQRVVGKRATIVWRWDSPSEASTANP